MVWWRRGISDGRRDPTGRPNCSEMYRKSVRVAGGRSTALPSISEMLTASQIVISQRISNPFRENTLSRLDHGQDHVQEVPAAAQLETLRAQNQVLMGDENSLRSHMVTLQVSEADMRVELESARAEMDATNIELVEVRRVSANALSLDTNNRRLAQETEVLKSRIEVLQADNQRLQSSAESDAFFNGALAVLLGVIITLLVPRLRPRRKSSSSWV